MALSIKEELELINGTANVTRTTDLKDLIHQVALGESLEFYDSAKDTTDNSLATSYKNKFYQISDRVLKQDEVVIKALVRIVIAIIAKQTFTYSQVLGADDPTWEDFVKDQMDEAFEYLSGIKADEKAAYIAI